MLSAGKMGDLYDGLLEELECKICMMYMSPPIRQCEVGHSICQNCRQLLPQCPLCQGRFTDSRNISLEALARKMHYPCVNAKLGCTMRLTLDTREKHEKECSFRGYKCAFPRCPWSGKYAEILEHWSQKKQTSRPYRNTNVCHTKIQKTEQTYVNIVQAYDQLFWYRFKCSGGKLYWSVQFIGNEEQATDFCYEIELFKPGQPVRKYLLSELCFPDHLEPFQPDTSVMINIDSVNKFFGEDQLLIYYFRVKKIGGTEDATEDNVLTHQSSNQNQPGRGGKKSGPHPNQNFKKYEKKRGGHKQT